MNEQALASICAGIAAGGKIGPDQVRALRSVIFAEVNVTQAEAETLFDLHDRNLPAGAEWPELFIEAMSDFIVEQALPRGYVSEDNARWLIGMIERDVQVWSRTELELVVKVLEKAISAPSQLCAFALEQVRLSVLAGDKRISADEVELIRRVLYAKSGSGGFWVSRPEAEALFDLDEATATAENDRGWGELFVRAIGNHVLGVARPERPSADDVRRMGAWLDDTSASPGRFLRRMLSGAAPEPVEAAEAPADVIDHAEAEWLRGRILRGGRIDANVRALLSFLEANTIQGGDELRDIARRA